MSYLDLPSGRTWHQVTGTGDPLVLLHGGIFGAESWAAQVGPLAAAGFAVHTPERRGHGHTPDLPGPITYELMAADTAGYLDAAVGGPADLVGWSDGAVVAVLVALARPDLVRRLVLVGQWFSPEGMPEDSPLLGLLEQCRADPPAFLHVHYDVTSPDGPEHFPVFLGKLLDMFTTEPRIPLERLAAITAPTLVVQGDRDEVRVDYSERLVGALPTARLAVLPGTHGLPTEQPELFNLLVTRWLRDEIPDVTLLG